MHPTILAINPGTRYLGVAIFHGDRLFDWQIHVLPSCAPAAKIKKVRALIARHVVEDEPDVMVLKQLHPSRRTDTLVRQCRALQSIAAAHGLRVYAYNIDAVKAAIQPAHRMNKRRLSELVCERYPVLRRTLQREQDALNPYHIRMFEAVALGIVGAARYLRLAGHGQSCHHDEDGEDDDKNDR